MHSVTLPFIQHLIVPPTITAAAEQGFHGLDVLLSPNYQCIIYK